MTQMYYYYIVSQNLNNLIWHSILLESFFDKKKALYIFFANFFDFDLVFYVMSVQFYRSIGII